MVNVRVILKKDTGHKIVLKSPKRELIEYIADLPEGSLLAGWPGHSRIIEGVPYWAAQPVLLSYELYAPFSVRIIHLLRPRMNAFIDAYFATELGPIRRLQDEFGVTHLIVNKRDYGKVPGLFQPFRDRTKKIWEEGTKKGFILVKYVDKGNLQRAGDDILVSISDLLSNE